MTFILVPNAETADVQINGWNWRPTLELLRSTVVRDEEHFVRLGAQGCGAELTAAEREAAALEIERVLARMKPGDRVLLDGTVTSEPTTGFLDDPLIYGATFGWLSDFIRFCRASGGFKVV